MIGPLPLTPRGLSPSDWLQSPDPLLKTHLASMRSALCHEVVGCRAFARPAQLSQTGVDLLVQELDTLFKQTTLFSVQCSQNPGW